MLSTYTEVVLLELMQKFLSGLYVPTPMNTCSGTNIFQQVIRIRSLLEPLRMF